jgi:hypothetical protein
MKFTVDSHLFRKKPVFPVLSLLCVHMVLTRWWTPVCIPWNIPIAIGDLDSEVEGTGMGFSRLFYV